MRPASHFALKLRIQRAFDHAAERQNSISFWWRDDDVYEPSNKLETLLHIAERHKKVCGFSAIVGKCRSNIAEFFRNNSNAEVLVHGLNHDNLGKDLGIKTEFPENNAESAQARLQRAFGIGQAIFGSNILPVFVAPWNNFPDEYVTLLHATGYEGLSLYGGPRRRFSSGIVRADTHIDIYNWRRGGELKAWDSIVDEIEITMRRPELDVIGIMTHHRNDPGPAAEFLDFFFDVAGAHPKVRFYRPSEVFSRHSPQ